MAISGGLEETVFTLPKDACPTCGCETRQVAVLTGTWSIDVFVSLSASYSARWPKCTIENVADGYLVLGPLTCVCQP